jgi:two-component system phosphate regulon response regulator OmpR
MSRSEPIMRHILVVDDDHAVCEVITDILEEQGYEVTCAANAAEARSHVANETFDGALVDVVMSGESGLSLADYLATLDIPVLVITGHPEAVREAGATMHQLLLKPFRAEPLLDAVNAMLALARG